MKNAPENWVAAARAALIEDGITSVKIDLLARRLGVTRGGFYNSYQSRDQLLDLLLRHWEEDCRFLPDFPPTSKAADAVRWFDHVGDWLIQPSGYDPQFDLAVREWARSDRRVAWAVERADRDRLSTLRRAFITFGYPDDAAEVRAHVFYLHQIGYYALRVQESPMQRKRARRIYLKILCGTEIPTAREARDRRDHGARSERSDAGTDADVSARAC